MRIRQAALLSLVALAASACHLTEQSTPESVGTQTQEVLNGEVRGPDDDPAVVALASQFGPFCTGTLVTPRSVLTAAHCIDQLDLSNPQIGIFFGSDIDDGSRLGVIGGSTRPGWDGQVGPDKPNDVGMILLKQAVNPNLPLPLNRRTPVAGETYRHVGFGVFDNALPSDGRKREGTVTVTAVAEGIISSGDAQVSICYGDSGGPGFVLNDGVEHVAGIHSYTSTDAGGCRFPAGDARVDQALDFIQGWLDTNDPSCGPDRVCATECTDDPDCASCAADGVCVVCADEDPDCPSKAGGEPCQQNEECEGGRCVTWDGDATSKFCSRECSTDDDCAGDMECRTFSNERLCYVKDNPTGRLGASCDEATECFSNLCDDSECVIACNLGLGLDCPVDFSCTGTGGGEFFCRADESEGDGGCQVSGHAATTTWMLLLLGLFGFVRRRRTS